MTYLSQCVLFVTCKTLFVIECLIFHRLTFCEFIVCSSHDLYNKNVQNVDMFYVSTRETVNMSLCSASSQLLAVILLLCQINNELVDASVFSIKQKILPNCFSNQIGSYQNFTYLLT